MLLGKADYEKVFGDPWSVIPIKSRKFAKDAIEIVLSKRKITTLINFDYFENLEALWLNHNKVKMLLKKIEKLDGLDKNFRLKILCLGNNRLTNLQGSISKLLFLEVLYLNDNKLRNLDENLTILKQLNFLKNLNLFNNPIAEEPEYRHRVIFALPSLEILDRHSINNI
jgi:Leucine-rich repeat (LRR) protein